MNIFLVSLLPNTFSDCPGCPDPESHESTGLQNQFSINMPPLFVCSKMNKLFWENSDLIKN